MEPDICMKHHGDYCECIKVHMDYPAIVLKDPKAITDLLSNKYNFKLKGTGPISYHLGCDFVRDSEGVLCFAPKKHIEKMIDSCKNIFGCKPKLNVSLHSDKGDHPELDSLELLDQDSI